MTRFKAFAIHLCISALIAVVVVSTMLFVWYPGTFFDAMGGNTLVMILVGVDVVLGPLITLIIFNPLKARHLIRLDLTLIGIVQAAALAYGVAVVAEVRPVYLVFTVDRFDLVAATDIQDEELAKVTRAEYRDIPWGKPRTVAAQMPADTNEQLRIIQAGANGADLQTFPQHYVPYETLASAALARAKPLADLRKRHPDELAAIDKAVKETGRGDDGLRFLPLKARNQDQAVLLDAKTGAIAGFARVNPW